ncbi:hypothetical protein KJ641_03335 [Patescibacteria group bacterium]|nr:hypothetical protein [Patescibacteria group bacterium]MBU1895876.1 hypothetical protein [Patescibacteria group bacterium]
MTIIDIEVGRFKKYLDEKSSPHIKDGEFVAKSQVPVEELWKHVKDTLIKLFETKYTRADFCTRALGVIDILDSKLQNEMKIEGNILSSETKAIVGGILDGLKTEIKKDWKNEDREDTDIIIEKSEGKQVNEKKFYERLVVGFYEELSKGLYGKGEAAENIGYDLKVLEEIFRDSFVNTKASVDFERTLEQALDTAVSKGGITEAGKYSKFMKRRVLKEQFLEFYRSFSERYSAEYGEGDNLIHLDIWKRNRDRNK